MKQTNLNLKTTHREEKDKKYLETRLKTIEGQIRGIRGMIDEDRYCGDILIQLSAVSKSLKSIGQKILKNHLSTCVVEEIQNQKPEIMEEVMDLIKKLDS